MAASDFLLYYRSKDTAWLQAKMTELEEQDTIFSAQSMGNTSMQRDLRTLQDKLTAITYILRERGAITITKPVVNVGVGVTDFRGIDGGDRVSQ